MRMPGLNAEASLAGRSTHHQRAQPVAPSICGNGLLSEALTEFYSSPEANGRGETKSIVAAAAAAPVDSNPSVSALARCIATDPITFAAEYWGRVPLLSRRAQLRGSFDDLLNLDAADELLSRRGLRTPFLRMVRDGELVSSRQFTCSGGPGATVDDQVRDDRVAELFAGGVTIVLLGLHRNWPPLIDFTRRLAGELGHTVQANAYITPPSSRGFSAHYDVHDVFVLQVVGNKHWKVHRPVCPSPLSNESERQHFVRVAAEEKELARVAAEEEPVLDIVLEPGDVLYLPRGYVHSAMSLGTTTAHLSVGVHSVTRFALVEALCALLAERIELRASLPIGIDFGDPAQLAPHLHTVVDELAMALREVPAVDVARWVRDKVWADVTPEPVGPIAQASFAMELHPEQVVRCRAGLRWSLRSEQDLIVLEMPDSAIMLPAVTRSAIQVLLGGGDVVVGELPGLNDDDRLVLVRRLLREGVLVPAAYN